MSQMVGGVGEGAIEEHQRGKIMLQKDINIGDKIKVGERIGEVVKIDHRPAASILKVAFEEGPALSQNLFVG